ncbi:MULTISPECIES: SMI1/KNR4 family protein [Bacillus]|uniref:SMI1/KNR4 family protein n=1 Tax=Bacillus TaxID=1386 RepID=UPI0003E22678|nr:MULTISPECIES: SMI1/KNR4 family protein [Bacillus]ETT70846.1 hypothetical protein C174_25689 [Bacillus mycoides FSL H7-687]MDI6530050.1 SMI1/KNR4 family protein [Bacillus mycoides]QWI12737.1 SMI1/KNR4 family protein [Bacillus mycoides]RAN70018.1 1,3-beta-glucan synthase regulator [Bacillus sp. SRB_8]WJE57307.1 SMI1/KNR4 family protein [Bacillus mycoides]
MFNFTNLEKVSFDRTEAEQVLDKYETVFFKIYDDEIQEAEGMIGFKFPKELRYFYKNVGSGFVKSNSEYFVNRLMDPESVADLRLRQDVYEENPRYDYIDDEESLAFFEINESSFLTLKFKQANELGQCPVYYGSTKIADSLEGFLIKMNENPDYYI